MAAGAAGVLATAPPPKLKPPGAAGLLAAGVLKLNEFEAVEVAAGAPNPPKLEAAAFVVAAAPPKLNPEAAGAVPAAGVAPPKEKPLEAAGVACVVAGAPKLNPPPPPVLEPPKENDIFYKRFISSLKL